ncbi:MAG: GTP-binding protein, partial [Bacteroidetes bacterium]
NNQISDISALQSLTNLTELVLSNNQISDISALQSLTNLTELVLSSNQISGFAFLQSLTNLTWLSLSDNQISDISFLKSLKNLTHLYLSDNQISDFAFLQSLKNLTQLNLSGNQISDITFLQSLINLTYLRLSSNQISDITSLQFLTKLKYLELQSNPFLDKIPAAIKSKDGLEILRYWVDTYTKKERAIPLRELKVVFVGEGFSGKTSLMHLLLYGKRIKTTRTESIIIDTDDTHFTYGENNEKLTLRFWDFGGQEIMHATHKFFMSEQTLYVLVTNGRKDEDEALQNWINMLKSSIGNSPVLLVANHLDNPADTNRINGDILRKGFKNLVLPVIETSYETGRGIDDLKNAIQTTLQKMPHFKEDFPPMYQAIREKLEHLDEPYIDFKEYNKICQNQAREKGETFEKESQKLLSNFLNDLGVMFNFGKKSDELGDLLILKPKWILDGVYKIINSEEAQKQRGKIKESTINQLLKESNYQTQQERSFIINIMEHFRLAYQLKSIKESYYLIPSLFDKDAPRGIIEIWDEKKETLCFQFQYEIWRNDYILYFLVNEHQNIKGDNYWVNGAILEYGNSQVLIETSRKDKHIRIEVAGNKDKQYALWRVREALNNVHQLFDEDKLGIKMFVIYKENNKEDKFSYSRLQNMYAKGIETEYSTVFDKDLNIESLLKGIAMSKENIRKRLEEAIEVEIPTILEMIAKEKNFSGYKKGIFNQFKENFYNRKDSFSLRGWKSELLVFLDSE